MPLIFSRKHKNYSKFSDRVYIQTNYVLYLLGIINNVEIKMIKRKRQNIRGKTSPLKSTQESCNNALYYYKLIKEFLWEKIIISPTRSQWNPMFANWNQPLIFQNHNYL